MYYVKNRKNHITSNGFQKCKLLDLFFSSGEQEFVDENPIKVGSQLLSMSIDPPINKKLKQPVSITFANCDVSEIPFHRIDTTCTNTHERFRGRSRTAATSKMEGWKPLTIITRRSILGVKQL